MIQREEGHLCAGNLLICEDVGRGVRSKGIGVGVGEEELEPGVERKPDLRDGIAQWGIQRSHLWCQANKGLNNLGPSISLSFHICKMRPIIVCTSGSCYDN